MEEAKHEDLAVDGVVSIDDSFLLLTPARVIDWLVPPLVGVVLAAAWAAVTVWSIGGQGWRVWIPVGVAVIIAGFALIWGVAAYRAYLAVSAEGTRAYLLTSFVAASWVSVLLVVVGITVGRWGITMWGLVLGVVPLVAGLRRPVSAARAEVRTIARRLRPLLFIEAFIAILIAPLVALATIAVWNFPGRETGGYVSNGLFTCLAGVAGLIVLIRSRSKDDQSET